MKLIKSIGKWRFVACAAIVVVAIGLLAMQVGKSSDGQICLLSQGDIVCVHDSLAGPIKRHNIAQNGDEIIAASVSPDKRHYLVKSDEIGELRDSSVLTRLDEQGNYDGYVLDLPPVQQFDVHGIQWTSDSKTAIIKTDIGVLYRYDVETESLRQLTENRGSMAEGELFEQNKRASIFNYKLANDNTLIMILNTLDYLELGIDSEEGAYLYSMDINGENVTRLSAQERVRDIRIARDGRVLFSVQRGISEIDQFPDEEKDLYAVNIDGSNEELLSQRELAFRDFTYSKDTDTVFLVRGPSVSVREVFYGKPYSLEKTAKKILLSWWPNYQTSEAIIPTSSKSLVVLNQFGGVTFSSLEAFDLSTGKRTNLLNEPELESMGAEGLVINY